MMITTKNMGRLVISLCMLFNLCSYVSADIVAISPKHLVKNNTTPSACMWCCVETLGNHFGIKSLKGIKAWHQEHSDGGATESQTKRQLKSLKVRFQETRNLTFIKNGIDKGMPFIVGIKNGKEFHAMILCGYDEKYIILLETANGRTHLVSQEWFSTNWNGWGLCIMED